MSAVRKPDAHRKIEFDDSGAMRALVGEHDRHLARVERRLGVVVSSRGNQVMIEGPEDAVAVAAEVFGALYARAAGGKNVDLADVDTAIRHAESGAPTVGGDVEIRTKRRVITARSPNQGRYLQALEENELVFGVGPAGTGKTYLAVAVAVARLMEGRVDRIILSRPAVEAGERIGFLPGDMREKVDPYLRPLYDALYDMLPADQVAKRLESGEIEVAPLAFMRGRTLAHSFVILDEAQNCTPVQMKMFLTRLGEGSQMAITGDPSQIDLPLGSKSGLGDACDILRGTEGIAMVYFDEHDVVRHDLVTKIVKAYGAREQGLLHPRRGTTATTGRTDEQ